MAKYDIIIQNSASKQTFLLTGNTDTSESHLYHRFEVEIDAPEGEYVYACVRNDRDDVEYEFKTPLLDTIVHAGEDEILLRDLQPSTGLLRIGENVAPENVYDKEDKNNNTTFYYYDE